MASEVARVSPELQHEVEQWYYEEARLLDERRYQSWLALVDPAIRYVMPGRGNPLVDNAMRGDEAMISVERELEDEASDGTPIRDETYAYLALRVERSFKPNAWAENPPARTRRLVARLVEGGAVLAGGHRPRARAASWATCRSRRATTARSRSRAPSISTMRAPAWRPASTPASGATCSCARTPGSASRGASS